MKFLIQLIIIAFFTNPAWSQKIEYPHDVITIVTHSSPGGGSDVFLRELITKLDDIMDASFVIENVRGGSGIRAVARVANGNPDGSIFYATTPTYILTSLLTNSSTNYSNLDPMVNIFYDQEIIYTSINNPVNELKDILEDTNRRYSWGAANPASLERIALEQLKSISGSNAAIITHDGGGELLLNILNGTLDIGIGEYQELEPQLHANQIKPLAILSSTRDLNLPNVPTLNELGYNVELHKFRGLAAPLNTPPSIYAIWDQVIQQLLANEEFVSEFEEQLLVPAYMNSVDANTMVDEFISNTQQTFSQLGMF